MAEFLVHNVRFYEFEAKAIHRLAYHKQNCKLALSREDQSVEIWDLTSSPYQEKVIHGWKNRSVEALLWCGERLFSTGFNGDLTEYDLFQLAPKASYQVTTGACWCMELSHSTNQIAIGTENGSVCLYTVSDERLDFDRLMDRQNHRIVCLSWHLNDEHLASGSEDVINIWNVKSARVIQTIMIGRTEIHQTTIVWCVKFTSDFQVISGDSSGKLCFWDAKYGTLVESIKTHRADILTFCLNETEDCLYASGVDPLICRVEKAYRNPLETETKNWVKTLVRTPHTHDVRALVLTGEEQLISAGVDSYLVQMRFKENVRTLTPPIPQAQLVSLNPKFGLLLFRYPRSLELWRLGSPSKTHGHPGEILPLSSNVTKLLSLHAKGEETITCCALSDSAEYLAYSTNASFRLFQLKKVDDPDDSVTQPSLSRVRFTLPGSWVCHHMTFVPRTSKLILVKKEGDIQMISVHPQSQLLHVFDPPKKTQEPVHLIAISSDGKYFAAADHHSNVTVFDVTLAKVHCVLPRQRNQPTALAFHPSTHDVVVMYSDKQLVEFSVEKCQLTNWSRSLPRPLPWHGKHAVLGLAFDPCDDNIIITYDSYQIGIIVKDEVPKMRSKTERYEQGDSWHWRKKRKDETSERPFGIHYCQTYKHILHVGVLAERQLVVSEVNQMRLIESLPDPFRRKKFGT